MQANLLIMKNKYSPAVELLETYISKNPNPDAYLKLGICYKNLMKNDQALTLLNKANQLKQNDTDILINLGSVYSSLGYNDKAVECLEKAVALDSTNLFTFINLAKLYIELDNLQYAKSIYQKLLNADSTNSYYHKQLAYVYQKLKEEKKAKVHFKISIEINSKDIFTISNLARIYYNEKKPDSAIAFIDKGLENFPDDTRLLKLKADILYSEKEWSSAVNVLVKILANNDESAQLYQRLGICYYQIAIENFVGDAQIKKLESAAETLQISFIMDSTQSLTALYLGMTYKELDKNKEAISYLERAAELIYPKFTSAIFTNLALVYQKEKNYSEAIKYFKQAQKYDANNPNYWYYLASTYDAYYYDKTVPMIYYQMFLSSSDSLDERLSNYAAERINRLKENIHFQNGSL